MNIKTKGTLVALACVVALTGCAVMSQAEVEQELSNGTEVVIEIAEHDTQNNVLEVGGDKYIIDTAYGATNEDGTTEADGAIIEDADLLLEEEDAELNILEGTELIEVFEEVYADYQSKEFSADKARLRRELAELPNYVPDGYTLPKDYEGQYKEWREAYASTALDTQTEQAPVQRDIFTDTNETVYATGTVNLRSGPGTSYEKVGSLSWAQKVTRIGIGTEEADGWSEVQLSDGTIVYVSNNYLSTTKPVSTSTSGSSGTTQQTPSNNTGGTQSGSQSEFNIEDNPYYRSPEDRGFPEGWSSWTQEQKDAYNKQIMEEAIQRDKEAGITVGG